MDKQKLIDKAVEDLKGKLPSDGNSPKFRDEYFTDSEYLMINSPVRVICLIDEFTQRAKELGWINGYKWGLEYPTNGKKPDLPDDVKVSAYCGVDGNWLAPRKVSSLLWQHAEAFRICDDRYKPKQPESHSKPSIDNSWHEKGDLPPVGVFCEYNSSGDKWHQVEITAHAKLGLCFIERWCTGENYTPRDARKFRPIKSEREKFVEQSLIAIGQPKVLHEDVIAYFKKQFNAGARFVNQESSS